MYEDLTLSYAVENCRSERDAPSRGRGKKWRNDDEKTAAPFGQAL